jgi:tetratricopeptide (TPR) repeat protein
VNKNLLALLLLVGVMAGCGLQVAIETSSGRSALLSGNSDLAISHFKRVAEAQPDYVVDSPLLRQSIWTYLGRAYYGAERLTEAKDAFSQGLKRDGGEFLARLYLGVIWFREAVPAIPAPKPNSSFSLSEILYALKERISPRRLTALVKERGANFELTAETEKELRQIGADDELMAQIRASARSRPAVAPTSPTQQGLREIERALKEIQTWHAGLRKSELGRAWDTRKRISSLVESSLSMLSSRRTDRPEFIAGIESLGRVIDEEVDLLRKK